MDVHRVDNRASSLEHLSCRETLFMEGLHQLIVLDHNIFTSTNIFNVPGDHCSKPMWLFVLYQ